jgi:hypothetical protein
MSILRVSRLATLSLALLSGACSDQVLAPAARLAPPGAARPDRSSDYAFQDSGAVDITVTPAGGSFALGPHSITFPANAICDPTVSSYGVTEWDKPCKPARQEIQIHAEIRRLHGREWVDFTPALRFVPTDDPSRFVWLYMSSHAALGTSHANEFNLLYSKQLDGAGIDETPNDASLRTYVSPRDGIVFRRIKHFSGYQVGAGCVGFEMSVEVEF